MRYSATFVYILQVVGNITQMDVKNRAFWAEFIEMYKNLPALWKVNSTDYTNRLLKTNAYEKMVEKLKEIQPDATREAVVKKINTIRTNYRRDLNKLKESQKSGGDPEGLFKPSLWYFDLLSFLEDRKNANDDDEDLSIYERYSDNTQDQNYIPLIESSKKKCKKSLAEESDPIKLPPKRSKTNDRSEKHETIIKTWQNYKRSDKNETEALITAWESEFKNMSNDQRIIAKKLFSDILYYGSMGKLNPSHVEYMNKLFGRSERSSAPISCYLLSSDTDTDCDYEN